MKITFKLPADHHRILLTELIILSNSVGIIVMYREGSQLTINSLQLKSNNSYFHLHIISF